MGHQGRHSESQCCGSAASLVFSYSSLNPYCHSNICSGSSCHPGGESQGRLDVTPLLSPSATTLHWYLPAPPGLLKELAMPLGKVVTKVDVFLAFQRLEESGIE